MSKKTMTEIRALAQSMGCDWKWGDDRNALEQKIKLKQTDMLPLPELPRPFVPDDQRTRTRPPSKVSDEMMITEMLKPYIALGLYVKFENGMFQMKHGAKTDSGTLRQPPRVIVDCARRLLA